MKPQSSFLIQIFTACTNQPSAAVLPLRHCLCHRIGPSLLPHWILLCGVCMGQVWECVLLLFYVKCKETMNEAERWAADGSMQLFFNSMVCVWPEASILACSVINQNYCAVTHKYKIPCQCP